MQNKRLTCLGSGGLSFDIVTERDYPEGYIKQKTYSDHILLQEAGGACGNLMSFLSYYGWETYPIKEAIQSMALLGDKSIIYQDESATIQPSTFAEDILCITDEIKEAKKYGRITGLDHIPDKDGSTTKCLSRLSQ